MTMAKLDISARDLGKRIGIVRRYRGYSEEYMAQRLGVSQRQYSRYESGESPLVPEKLTEACKVLEIAENDLRHFDEKAVFTHCTGAME